ncbi:MAG: LamG domain-containing protein [Armatimonadetes bacterium]|nr:LamG domain-containing protein [Armatimonadota bacterium]
MATIAWGKGSGGDVCLPWSGNASLEALRLVNAGQPDDDLLLAFNEFVPDENTVGLWHLNEAGWTGTPDEVLDASGEGHHGKAINGATTTDGWLDRAGQFEASQSQMVEISTVPSIPSGVMTLECWVYVPDTNSYGVLIKIGDSDGVGLGIGTYLRTADNKLEAVYEWATWVHSNQTVGTGWHHVAFASAGTSPVFWIDGVEVPVTTGRTPYAPTKVGGIGGQYDENTGLPSRCISALIDEVRVSEGVRYSGDFSPTRYPTSGTVVAQYTPPSSSRLTELSWDGTFGADYGQVRAIYVNSGGDWQQVGGDYPSSPITGLNLPVTGPDLVKVELEPRQDALQSETPTLDWLQVVLETTAAPAGRHRLQTSLARRRFDASDGTRLATTLARSRLDTRSD